MKNVCDKITHVKILKSLKIKNFKSYKPFLLKISAKVSECYCLQNAKRISKKYLKSKKLDKFVVEKRKNVY